MANVSLEQDFSRIPLNGLPVEVSVLLLLEERHYRLLESLFGEVCHTILKQDEKGEYSIIP